MTAISQGWRQITSISTCDCTASRSLLHECASASHNGRVKLLHTCLVPICALAFTAASGLASAQAWQVRPDGPDSENKVARSAIVHAAPEPLLLPHAEQPPEISYRWGFFSLGGVTD